MTKLTYPFTDLPEPGCTLEVADGVRWLRMPLPMALNHINLYLLEDDDGWWIVDTGIKWGEVKTLWLEIIRNELKDKPIKAVLITHNHPDHIGQAGWLCSEFKVPLYITVGEYYTARAFSTVTADHLDWTSRRYYLSVGFDDAYFDNMKSNFQGYGAVVEPMPNAFRRLEEGMLLTIAGREWRVVIGRGHSPEHACLYCEELQLLLSGDQVIPKITSNVSVMPVEPEANPLADWLASLEKLKSIPDSTLICPAHNTPFRGLHARLNYLIEHHQDHLLALEEACVDAKTALQLLPVLFKRKLDASQMMMAMGECVAHLNYLVSEQKLRIEDRAGVYYYLSIDPTLEQRARPGTHHRDDAPMQI
ncbi:MBL fold metallo-hydrolase [Oceanicoccus sp. KOV_DT_Chl]|uniref:MBL fold metallo-hydrolase n=1 Tax=Oceanicoccus sp. KOV_DT_Chl TaxID=1904639 RepID=UPI000C7B67E7|nr:MBL fold metallo-hydrolase [Oceanicoccus sp. KOV_DT_Chl]